MLQRKKIGNIADSVKRVISKGAIKAIQCAGRQSHKSLGSKLDDLMRRQMASIGAIFALGRMNGSLSDRGDGR